jgi:phenylacetate-coenzyme A ligase PaaK-like adenylate-forming protein
MPIYFPTEYYRNSKSVLELALKHVPAYKAWRSYDSKKKSDIDFRYKQLPVLTKSYMRQYAPEDFVPEGKDVRRAVRAGTIERVNTNGTTDEKVTTIWYWRWWYNSENESWALNKYTAQEKLGEHREALLASAMSVGRLSNESDLTYRQRIHGTFFYLNEKSSPEYWTEKHMDRMIRELDRFQPIILEANPSYLYRLARYVENNKLKIYQPKIIVLTFELPSQIHLRQFRRVFVSPICSSYGTTETGYVFMECEHGRFHQNVKSCRVDFVPFAKNGRDRSLGRLLVTPFNNPWQIILRFDTGDIGILDRNTHCPCGRDEGITLTSIEGRVKNLTTSTSGGIITENEVDRVFGEVEGLVDYQIIQVNSNEYIVRFVPERGSVDMIKMKSLVLLKELYGKKSKISFSREREIVPTVSGKFRRVFSTIQSDIKF